MSIIFGSVACMSSLWAANATVETCRERPRNDIVEIIRFYTGDSMLVVNFILMWQTTFVFTEAARKNKATKTKSAATAAAAASCANASSLRN